MLIVRGVNVFPSAVREVVSTFAPDVSGHILVRPNAPGVKQEPPLPVHVELARDAAPGDALAADLLIDVVAGAAAGARPIRACSWAMRATVVSTLTPASCAGGRRARARRG
jgi:hypothetical protein